MTAKVTVGGKTLYTMLVSAANTLENNKAEINDLNVFPVPDGDTGTNMSLTLGAVRRIQPKDESVSDCATQAADAVLIDSSDLSIEEVVAVIASLCREKRKTPN